MTSGVSTYLVAHFFAGNRLERVDHGSVDDGRIHDGLVAGEPDFDLCCV